MSKKPRIELRFPSDTNAQLFEHAVEAARDDTAYQRSGCDVTAFWASEAFVEMATAEFGAYERATGKKA